MGGARTQNTGSCHWPILTFQCTGIRFRMDGMDTLTRYPQRGGDRRLLDEILDEGVVAVLSTVADGLPWSVPIAYARLGDRIVLHGSTGPGPSATSPPAPRRRSR